MKTKKDFRFDQRAEHYDEGFEGRSSRKFYDLIADHADIADGMQVLDLGCGTGTVLHRLSEQHRFSGYGIDIEERMLEQARRKCSDMQFQNCPCDRTPFPDGRFDVLIACMAYHHFPDPEGFAKECARLLKRGGRLYLADPKLPFPARQVLNTALTIHRINGRVYTANESGKRFAAHGFQQVFAKSDAYAQCICLERSEK